MQESSKGEISVESDCFEREIEMQDIPSAFHFVGKDGKPPRPNSGSKRSEKRDSGYATDNSPGLFLSDNGNNSLQFTFDLDTMEQGSTGNPDDIPDEKIDEEVEMVLSHQRNVSLVSGPTTIPPVNRPSAPVPRGSDTEELRKSESLPTFHSFSRHDMWRRNRNRGHYFRPIESRSLLLSHLADGNQESYFSPHGATQLITYLLPT
ncbi:hypothetical protein KUTeg_014325 [Tegillarca granosa]|uniref:Uncharacterized protein n=1 Tax=Tegillarca granosa TaxID=220873 RepID=A0ABQ9EYS2_TEGGR|nr:hypothetical protein KUTeg_014325 [Tegillarca granosa]